MNLRLAILVIVFSFSEAGAEAVKLSGTAITSLLTDKTLYGEKDTSQLFLANGATFYAASGGQQSGSWRVDGDTYCSQWPPNPSWACYVVLRDGDIVLFVSAGGNVSQMRLKP